MRIKRHVMSGLVVTFIFGYLTALLWFDGANPVHLKLYFLWDKVVLFLAFALLATYYNAHKRYFVLAAMVAGLRVGYEILLWLFNIQTNKETHITLLFIVVIIFILNWIIIKTKLKWPLSKR